MSTQEEKLAALNAAYAQKQAEAKAAQDALQQAQDELINAHSAVFSTANVKMSNSKIKSIISNSIKQPYSTTTNMNNNTNGTV